ncbi:MAG: protein kinase [Planctomycetes bacterium]|nr:protein kinase [Planctomycetota bacterium]
MIQKNRDDPAFFGEDRPGDQDPMDPRIARALSDFIDRRAAGAPLDSKRFLEEHADLAPLLGGALEAIDEVRSLVSAEPISPLARLGDFQIIREIGRGGMGIVYEAWQVPLARRVAIKVLPAGLLADEKAVARFRREAQVAARLQHENIVKVFGLGIEDGVPYFAMEFVEGKTLRQIYGRPEGMDSIESAGRNRVPAAECRRLAEAFAAVAEGLHHAHGMGVIHRDLKPSNLILEDRFGRLRILDFGLARMEGQDQLTLSQEYLGTPLYMSPEQVQGGRQPLGPGTDIYSLGVTLYEVLAGQPPFRARTQPALLSQITHRDAPPLRRLNPEVPRDLETIVLKCLRKKPRERYATAEALAQDLRRFVRRELIEARPLSLLEILARRAWRHRGKLAAAVLVAFLLIYAALLSVSNSRQARRQREADYQTAVLQAVMKMQKALLVKKLGGGNPLRGEYFDWFYLPQEGALVDRSDFQSMVHQAGGRAVEEALLQLQKAAALFPERPDAFYHRARALMLLGRDGEARKELLAALEFQPGFVPARVLGAAILEREGQREEARRETEKAAATKSSGGWAESWLAANQAAGKGKWSKAAEAYKRLMAFEASGKEPYLGSSIETLLGHGLALLGKKDYYGALEAFSRAQGRWPESPEPTLFLGKAYLLKGELEQAEGTFAKLLALPSSGDEIALSVAELYGSVGENEKAIEWVGLVREGYLRERNRAAFLIKLSRWEEACRAGEEAVRLRPDDALSCLWWGLALLVGKHRDEEAGTLLEKARALDPENPLAAVWLGDVLARQGKLEAALKAYGEAIAIDPRNAWAHVSRGVTLERLDRLKEAMGEYLDAFEIDSTLASAYIHLDALFQREKRPDFGAELDRLVHLIEGVLDSGEGHPLLSDLLRILALSLLEDSQRLDLEKALLYAARAVEMTRRQDPKMLAALARAQFARGFKTEAVLSLEEALRLPHANRRLPDALKEYRQAVYPDLASYASMDAALEGLDTDALIPAGAPWRFFRGKSEPSSGLDWVQPDFDDAGWEAGPSGFGYGDGDDATILSDMKNSYTALYVRHSLEVKNPAACSALRFSVRFDDGLLAWLNGRKICRLGVGREDGRLPFDAIALNFTQSEPLGAFEFSVDTKLLRAGKNVLAIQGLNAQKDSSDLSLIPVLEGKHAPAPEKDKILLEDFQRAMAEGGGHRENLQASPRLAYLEGLLLRRQKRYPEAEKKLREVLALDPSRPEPVAQLAETLAAMGRWKEAEEMLRRALEEKFWSDHDLWRRWLGLNLVDLQRPTAELIAGFPRQLAGGRGEMPPQAAGLPENCGADALWALERLEVKDSIRINCGGDDYRDHRGRLWGRDRFFGSGYRFGGLLWSVYESRRSSLFEGEIDGTEDDPLYQTERWFLNDELSPYFYRIPLPPGNYQVILHFAEIHFKDPGKRLFDIHLEGKEALAAYEPFAKGYAAADQQSFTVEVVDGFLDLDFVPQVEYPKISAIEVLGRFDSPR